MEHWTCPECGPHTAIDEDGCCSSCGADCYLEPCGGHVCGTVLAAVRLELRELAALLAGCSVDQCPSCGAWTGEDRYCPLRRACFANVVSGCCKCLCGVG